MSLSQNLSDFRTAVAEMVEHMAYAHQKYRNNEYKINRNLREFISESAFLRIFIAWESFIECCFIDYLLNEPSILNRRPAKWVTPMNREHANNIIIGTQKYMDWSNPDIIRRISQFYFHQGYVFNTSLSAISNDLMDLRTIRNSAAHSSSVVTTKLDGLSTRILGVPCQNSTAYKLLYSVDPRSPNRQTVLEGYLEHLDIAAEEIANG